MRLKLYFMLFLNCIFYHDKQKVMTRFRMLKANILQKELVAIMLLELKKVLNRDHRKLNYLIFVQLFFSILRLFIYSCY